MPVMNGIEATTKIRTTIGLNRLTPIVAMTANAFADDREACHRAGMNDFIPKPVRFETLHGVITSIVQGMHKAS